MFVLYEKWLRIHMSVLFVIPFFYGYDYAISEAQCTFGLMGVLKLGKCHFHNWEMQLVFLSFSLSLSILVDECWYFISFCVDIIDAFFFLLGFLFLGYHPKFQLWIHLFPSFYNSCNFHLNRKFAQQIIRIWSTVWNELQRKWL